MMCHVKCQDASAAHRTLMNMLPRLAANGAGIAAMLFAAGVARAGTFQEVKGYVVMEAENATRMRDFAVESQAMASGGKGVRVGASVKAGGGELAFEFVLATGGTYTIYIRTLCEDHLNNGLWLQLDGKYVVAPPTDPYAGVRDIYLNRPGWYWRPRWQGPGAGNHGGAISLSAPAGRHTLVVVKRGVETPFIDKIVLAFPGLPGPQDLGPPETPEGSAPLEPTPRPAADDGGTSSAADARQGDTAAGNGGADAADAADAAGAGGAAGTGGGTATRDGGAGFGGTTASDTSPAPADSGSGGAPFGIAGSQSSPTAPLPPGGQTQGAGGSVSSPAGARAGSTGGGCSMALSRKRPVTQAATGLSSLLALLVPALASRRRRPFLFFRRARAQELKS
jgi:hypothetical protein